MKKKGFTLIELIAVLVILTIIALIVTPLLLNVVKKSKESANKRSVDAYGKSIELAIANYMQKKRDYPSSFEDIEVEYTGKEVECKVFIFNDDVDGSIYLSGCSVGGKEVLDNSTIDGYYHYGKERLNNRYYISTYGLFVEKAIDEYIAKNNSAPSSLDDLPISYTEKNVRCNKFEMTSEDKFFISECSVDGLEVLDENSADGYYHYGRSYKKYSIGDKVTYNNMDFYVIENSDETKNYVTLLKSTPLTTNEVNTYGAGHINMYLNSTESYYQAAADMDGYGGIAYYTSQTCGYPIVYPNSGYYKRIETGCINSYDTSDVKYVVDNWAKEFNSDLTLDDMGYNSRIITLDDLLNNLNCKEYSSGVLPSSSTPNWVFGNYSYWTMTPINDNTVYYVTSSSISSSYYLLRVDAVIRPVINLKKSALTA